MNGEDCTRLVVRCFFGLQRNGRTRFELKPRTLDTVLFAPGIDAAGSRGQIRSVEVARLLVRDQFPASKKKGRHFSDFLRNATPSGLVPTPARA